jgi:LPS-assembly protein
MPAGLTGRGGRVRLSGRPAAWYSSLILERNAATRQGRETNHERARIVCGSSHSMLRSILFLALAGLFVVLGTAARASAQGGADISNCKNSLLTNLSGMRFSVKNDKGLEEMRMILTGAPDRPVRIDCDDMHLSADQMEVFDGHQVVATGNVLFESETNRIAADRLEFDTNTRTGTFYNASGTVSLANRVDRSMFGTQEPDAMFRGDEIHKLGPDTYKIVHGAFTTCVQPTPRWEMVAGSVTLKLNDHALLTNALLRVKGVPVMYLPIFYYPVQDDDRATGFLIPTYGTSTVRGQSITNYFFWAIDRSQDATIEHDWYSKTGQAIGGEYRYELGGGNRGNAQFNLLNEHSAAYQQADGSVKTTSAAKNFLMRGGLSQALGAGFHARANVNYTSSLAVQQRYQQDILQTNNRTRNIGGNVTGNWKGYVLSATAEKNDTFYDENSFTSTGGLPRISFSRGERPIGKSKIYFGVNSEYVTQIYKTEQEGVTRDDRGLTRLDVNPVVRIPFTKWPFLTLNSTVSWRDTYWTESLNTAGVQIPDSVNRRFFDLQARITGPVFNRIFDTPNNGYATKFKHVIEPTVVIQRVTGIDVFNQIVRTDGTDTIVGGTTRVTYSLNNRLYAKKESAREIVSLGITQSYYSNSTASQFDSQYQSSYNASAKPKNFSPVRIQSRVAPSGRFNVDFSTEFNSTAHTFTTFTASGSYNSSRFQVTGGWSERRYLPNFPGFDNLALANHDLNASTTIHNPGNHLGGTYSFNYDIRNTNFRQQRILAFYNAQCCGINIEYQTYNLGGASRFVVPQDHRFNLSFTLAGIGTFSNFFGAFGGQTGR